MCEITIHFSLTARGAENLITGIDGAQSLKELKLNNCDLRDLGGAFIAKAMTTNLSIKVFQKVFKLDI